jgi:hypothetical protein
MAIHKWETIEIGRTDEKETRKKGKINDRDEENGNKPSIQTKDTKFGGRTIRLTNSVAWVRERTIATERPPLVSEISDNFFCGYKVPRGQRDGSLRPYSRLSRPGGHKISYEYYEVKVKLSLCLTKHYATKAYGGSGCIDSRFLDLGTSWKWVVSFTLLPLYPEVNSGNRWIRGWVEPRADMNCIEKWKFLTLPRLELRPLGRPARSQSLYRLNYRGSPI